MKKFQDLTFSDHYMFEKVLQNKDICKQLLERLLKIKIEKLEFPELEKEIRTRGVRYIEPEGYDCQMYIHPTRSHRISSLS